MAEISPPSSSPIQFNSTEQYSHCPSPSQASQSRENLILIARSLVKGNKPKRCEINSSFKTEEFPSISMRSIAMVGTSAIIIRRSALAMQESVSRSSNFMKLGLTSQILIRGKRWSLLNKLGCPSVHHCYGEQNMISDALAKQVGMAMGRCDVGFKPCAAVVLFIAKASGLLEMDID
ncbi:putative lamin-like protein-like [Capsicum annuum]|nr:putative lamin-like protein-like [Capsicum annuum]